MSDYSDESITSNDATKNLTTMNRIEGQEDDNNRPSILRTVASYIIVTEFCERLAYYGFSGSLVLFFQTVLKYNNSEADIQYSIWSGFCYIGYHLYYYHY